MERGSPWSEAEVRATVEDYFWMLEKELRGESYNKSARRRALVAQLEARPGGAVERKHQNISAVLWEIGFPFIHGYKPLPNYQGLLREVVLERLALAGDVEAAADDLSRRLPGDASSPLAQVDPPGLVVREKPRALAPGKPRGRFKDYVERDHRNRDLGLRGEEMVIRLERERLVRAGRGDLAHRIQWTSEELGDGFGYDIESYDERGAIRLIEVKTTNHHDRFPFMVTRNELAVSETRASDYALVRVFDFSRVPRFFELPGAIRNHVELEPSDYRATFVRVARASQRNH